MHKTITNRLAHMTCHVVNKGTSATPINCTGQAIIYLIVARCVYIWYSKGCMFTPGVLVQVRKVAAL